MDTAGRSGMVRTLPVVAGVAVACAAAAWLGRSLAVADGGIAAMWPPAGLALGLAVAAAARRDRTLFLAVLAGIVVGNVLFNTVAGFASLLVVAFAGANTVSVLVGCATVRAVLRRAGGDASSRGFAAAIAAAAVVAPAAGGLIGAAGLHAVLGVDPVTAWTTWWSADALAIVALAPLALLSVWPPLRDETVPGGRAEAIGLMLAVPVATALACSTVLFATPQPFVLLPLLVWAAVRLGVGGVALANAAFAIVCVAVLAREGWAPAQALMQAKLGLFCLIALTMATLMGERRAAEARLRAARAALQQQADASLRSSEARFEALTQALPGIVFEADPHGRVTFVSRTLDPAADALAARAAGEPDVGACHPDDRAQVLERWHRAVADVVGYEARMRLRDAGDGWRWHLSRARPVVDAQGRVQRWVGVTTDIDALVQAESMLRDADRRKDEFLAMLAHELRNPLAPIRNAVRLIEAAAPPDEGVRQAHRIIDRQSRQLARLVDDLLDIARVASGKVRLARSRVDLRACVDAGVETARPLIGAKRQVLRLASRPDAPVWVDGDAARLIQAIGNVVCNAAKYTPAEGSIEVAIMRTDAGEARVTVRDDGPGIAPAMLTHVFDLFVQSDVAAGRSDGGLGIGLAMVRNLVELHGGRVHAESDGPGLGACFVLSLPLAAGSTPAEPASVDPPPAAKAPPAAPTPRRLLIVDDNADFADSLAVLLRLEGHAVTICADGMAGRDRALAERFDVVLLDLGLPRFDGCAVAQALRERGESRDALLIAVTGFGQPEDRARTARAGFDVHLTKPLELDVLLARLQAPRAALPDRIGARAQSPQVQRLLAAWHELQPPDGDLPQAEALLAATASMADRRVVATVASLQPFRMRFDAVGAHWAPLAPDLVPGQQVDGDDAQAGSLVAPYQRAAHSGQPVFESAAYDFGIGDRLRFERLVVPVCDGADRRVPSRLVALVSLEPEAPASRPSLAESNARD